MLCLLGMMLLTSSASARKAIRQDASNTATVTQQNTATAVNSVRNSQGPITATAFAVNSGNVQVANIFQRNRQTANVNG